MAAYERGGEESAEDHATRLLKLLAQRDDELREARRLLESFKSAGNGGYAQALALPIPQDLAEEDSNAARSLQEAEARLAEQTQAAQSPMVMQLLAGLQAAAVYTDTPNHETNRKLWDAYAKDWAPEKDWVKRMASHLPGGGPAELQCVGEEWSDDASLRLVLDDWLLRHTEATSRVAEIGSGGGRIANLVAPEVAELVCFDISSEMLKSAKKFLDASNRTNVKYQLIDGESEYPKEHIDAFDFVYCFDVLVHVDLHQMRRTLRNTLRILKPGGRCFVSFANLLAPGGWQRFARQEKYSVGGFYFVSPDIARCLLVKCGFEVLSMSSPCAGNTYLNRDLLVLARRPVDTAVQAAAAAA
eukprot:TRINITY_DN20850_c1_g1_i1.p1 TRINITY_DN20850_c1_g1~~TRINITY_DN20850_c1_g1_i1.p1  ORF type:complete len:377 (+),score=91.72 TRINITY_DN20850_c1_g1_i1:60-1133(+)